MKQLDGQGEKSIKVVLDTNVLISAFLFRKNLGIIAELIDKQVIIPCFIETTFSEFREVIQYPKFKPIFSKLSLLPQQLLELIIIKSLILPDPEFIPKVTHDTPDNFILACALTAQASFIISGAGKYIFITSP